MKNNKIAGLAATIMLMLMAAPIALTQSPQLLKRTTTKTDKIDFGSGGTVAVVGAPNGSIRVEGWTKNELEISAEIELQAESEADLAKLSEVTGYITEESPSRTGIISIGTNDKQNLKKSSKKFPRNLLDLPFRIDYAIHVPYYCDLEINGGKGDLTIKGVEGT